MISFLGPRQAGFLERLNAIQERADRAQREIASGRRINVASDHPDQIGHLLQVRAELASTDQTKINLARVKSEVDTAETSVQNAIRIVERVRVLGSQALTGTQAASSRSAIAAEVSSLLEQLVAVSNTQIDGRYIFAGGADQAAPYAVDLTTPSGVTAYAGGTVSRQIRDASGVRLNISRTGPQIFDHPTASRNAFAAVNGLRTALLANDISAIEDSFSNIGTALDHVNEQLAFYGATQNHIAESIADAESKSIALQTQIAETEGADLAEAILALQNASTHRQAALQARAQEDRRTVLDFIR